MTSGSKVIHKDVPVPVISVTQAEDTIEMEEDTAVAEEISQRIKEIRKEVEETTSTTLVKSSEQKKEILKNQRVCLM